jgi:hypothetical protein
VRPAGPFLIRTPTPDGSRRPSIRHDRPAVSTATEAVLMRRAPLLCARSGALRAAIRKAGSGAFDIRTTICTSMSSTNAAARGSRRRRPDPSMVSRWDRLERRPSGETPPEHPALPPRACRSSLA